MVRTIIALVALLAASAAQADWQFTRWGMSPQELIELGQGKIIRLPPGQTSPNVTEYQGKRGTTMAVDADLFLSPDTVLTG